jgi:hypothetical protein
LQQRISVVVIPILAYGHFSISTIPTKHLTYSFEVETVKMSSSPTIGILYPDFASPSEDCVQFSYSSGSNIFVSSSRKGTYRLESVDAAGIWNVLDDLTQRVAKYSWSDDGSAGALFYFGEIDQLEEFTELYRKVRLITDACADSIISRQLKGSPERFTINNPRKSRQR